MSRVREAKALAVYPSLDGGFQGNHRYMSFPLNARLNVHREAKETAAIDTEGWGRGSLTTLRQRGREGEGDALIPRLLRPRNWTKDEGDVTEQLRMRRDSKIKAHQNQTQ